MKTNQPFDFCYVVLFFHRSEQLYFLFFNPTWISRIRQRFRRKLCAKFSESKYWTSNVPETGKTNVSSSELLIGPHRGHNTRRPVWPSVLSCFLLVLIDSVSLHVSTRLLPRWQQLSARATVTSSAAGCCVRKFGEVDERWLWANRRVQRLSGRLTSPRSRHDRADGWVSA